MIHRTKFSSSALLAWHIRAQSLKHPLQDKRSRPIRIEPAGKLAFRACLPLDLCQPRNRLRKEQVWQAAVARKRVLGELGIQCFTWNCAHPGRLLIPLTGRPIVNCIRYSTLEPDSTAGWGKLVVDCLQQGGTRKSTKTITYRGVKKKVTISKPYTGLGIIRSDRPSDCDVNEWWEPAPRGQVGCVFEVWTGESR
jgi:hypothetical protein